MRPLGLLMVIVVLILLAGCSGIPFYAPVDETSFRPARLTNLSDAACRDSLFAQVTSVLVKEGETQDAARLMTTGLFVGLQHETEPEPEPGPFFIFSPGGVRYGFFLQETEFGCVLRLYERRLRLGAHVSNDVSTIYVYDLASRTLLYCSCREEDPQQDISQKH